MYLFIGHVSCLNVWSCDLLICAVCSFIVFLVASFPVRKNAECTVSVQKMVLTPRARSLAASLHRPHVEPDLLQRATALLEARLAAPFMSGRCQAGVFQLQPCAHAAGEFHHALRLC